MEIKSELKLGTLAPWMTKLCRAGLLISASRCDPWPRSLCIHINKSREGKLFDLDSFLPQRAKRQYVLLLRMCSDFQSPDAPQLVNCITCILWKISVPRLDGDLPKALQGKETTDSVPCLETPLSLNKDHH